MLGKSREGQGFYNEAALESFFWKNLSSLLGLKPLKQQYRVRGEVCDILAIDSGKRLVILELKNAEDRYIVQQLTRYYENILEERPLSSQIDYTQSIRLIAIAPDFHEDSLIDLKYHTLDLELLRFQIIQRENRLYLTLNTREKTTISQVIISESEEYIINPENAPNSKILPRPPKALLNLIEKESLEKQNIVLDIREKIIRFDERMGENSTEVTIGYGKRKGKNQLYRAYHTRCAEFHRDQYWVLADQNLDDPDIVVHTQTTDLWGEPLDKPQYSYSKKIVKIELFLYLPFPQDETNQRIIKVLVRTNDWKTVSEIVLPYRYKEPWKPGTYYPFEQYLNLYYKMTGKLVKSNSLQILIDLALDEWKGRN
ncbi:MAG: endonuclease NucS domain-containing protein [Lyngbya sp.]|nr:endonuclease NucS domain-containing protein [Lyngbya sp.]